MADSLGVSQKPSTIDSKGDRGTSKHVNSICGCRTIQAPSQDITTILRERKIPILTVQVTGTDKLDLGAKAFDGNTKYVAMSDGDALGIGSSMTNSIRTCQLVRIAGHMGEIYLEEGRTEVCLWLDTLCIPSTLDDQDLKAVPSIDEIKKGAHATLVLDGDDLRIDRNNLQPKTDARPLDQDNKTNT